MPPSNGFWFKSVTQDYENKDKRYVISNMRTMIKPDIDPNLNASKSRPHIKNHSSNMMDG